MRILQICRSLGVGGIETVIRGLANELAKTNEVTVCTIRQPLESDWVYHHLDPSIKKETLGKLETTSPIKVVFQLYKYIKNGDFDVVHIHCFFYFYALAILLLHKQTKFVYTIHSDPEKENLPWDLRLLAFKRHCFRRKWVHPVTISLASKEAFIKLYGCDSKLIMNGLSKPSISLENLSLPYRISGKTRVFVNPARVSPPKNQGMLCKVFDRLIKDGWDVALVIAGPNHDVASYQSIEPFLSERIIYLNEHHDIPSLLHYSDGLCLSSAWEGMPMVIIEALAVGCPCICTPVGGVVNMIESGQNGILSKSVSEEDYYDAMRHYLSLSNEDVALMREKAKESYSKYDVKNMVSNYYDYYRSIV